VYVLLLQTAGDKEMAVERLQSGMRVCRALEVEHDMIMQARLGGIGYLHALVIARARAAAGHGQAGATGRLPHPQGSSGPGSCHVGSSYYYYYVGSHS
jgi:hypothetical protein